MRASRFLLAVAGESLVHQAPDRLQNAALTDKLASQPSPHPRDSPVSGLLAKKPLQTSLGEAKGDHLRRVLGPYALTALGIGAVIGSGIFVTTGRAANQIAGPALMVSYVLAGFTCLLAALCYAEFAAMTPVAGSAYTYAYTTLGEIFAWVIGWDLILEYAVGASTVATGWSAYFSNFLTLFPKEWGLAVPGVINDSPIRYGERGVSDALAAVLGAPAAVVEPAAHAHGFWETHSIVNLPAVLVIVLLSAILFKGIKESTASMK